MNTKFDLKNYNFPDNYQALLGDFKKLLSEYNHLCDRLDQLECINEYREWNRPTFLNDISFHFSDFA